MKTTKNQTKKAERISSLRGKARGQFYCENGGKFCLTLMQNPRTKKTEPCPFCGLRYRHGLGPGHLVAHCYDRHIFTNDRGETFDSFDGYIIEVAGSEDFS